MDTSRFHPSILLVSRFNPVYFPKGMTMIINTGKPHFSPMPQPFQQLCTCESTALPLWAQWLGLGLTFAGVLIAANQR